MHSNGHENSCRFACVCVSKIYRASSSGNWVTKALQLGPQARNSLSGRRLGREWPGVLPSCGKTAAVERAVGQASEMWGTFLFSMRIPRRGDRFNGMATAQRAQVMGTSCSRACPEVEPVARGEIPDLNIVAFETPNR